MHNHTLVYIATSLWCYIFTRNENELKDKAHYIYSFLVDIVYACISSNSIHSLLGLADKLNAVLQDSCAKILDMLQGKPDLVIGNYTDGNLVASLVSRKLGVTQVMNNDPLYQYV